MYNMFVAIVLTAGIIAGLSLFLFLLLIPGPVAEIAKIIGTILVMGILLRSLFSRRPYQGRRK